jgi:nucleolar complex protein 3
MGRKQRKLAQLQQTNQAKAFFTDSNDAPDLSSLDGPNKRLKIAKLCSEIQACPELNHSKLKVLLQLTGNPEVQGLVLVSLCALFIDIAPGYHIKSKFPEGKIISREVKALRTYEGLILRYYSEYLAILKDFAKTNLGGIKCLCRLLRKLPHFNFAKDLICFLVRQLNKAPDPILDAFAVVLNSKEFEVRYQVVKQLHHWLKATSYKQVPAQIVDMLSNIDLSHLEVAQTTKKTKMEADVDKDLGEAEATVRQDDLAKSVKAT